MTEKNYNPEQKGRKTMQKIETATKIKNIGITKKEVVSEEPKAKAIVSEKSEPKAVVSEAEPKKAAKEKASAEAKKQTKPKIKRTEAVVKSYNLPISTKKSSAICKFIKGKTIENALSDLEKVVKIKKAVPMRGEIPHRKGKIMAGRFPKETAKHFILLLKSLAGNANVNEIDNPVIVEAFANIGSLPYARFGAWRRKKTNVKIVAREKKNTHINKGRKK